MLVADMMHVVVSYSVHKMCMLQFCSSHTHRCICVSCCGMILLAYTLVYMGVTSRMMHQTRTHSQKIYHHNYEHCISELAVLPATKLQRLKDLT